MVSVSKICVLNLPSVGLSRYLPIIISSEEPIMYTYAYDLRVSTYVNLKQKWRQIYN